MPKPKALSLRSCIVVLQCGLAASHLPSSNGDELDWSALLATAFPSELPAPFREDQSSYYNHDLSLYDSSSSSPHLPAFHSAPPTPPPENQIRDYNHHLSLCDSSRSNPHFGTFPFALSTHPPENQISDYNNHLSLYDSSSSSPHFRTFPFALPTPPPEKQISNYNHHLSLYDPSSSNRLVPAVDFDAHPQGHNGNHCSRPSNNDDRRYSLPTSTLDSDASVFIHNHDQPKQDDHLGYQNFQLRKNPSSSGLQAERHVEPASQDDTMTNAYIMVAHLNYPPITKLTYTHQEVFNQGNPYFELVKAAINASPFCPERDPNYRLLPPTNGQRLKTFIINLCLKALTFLLAIHPQADDQVREEVERMLIWLHETIVLPDRSIIRPMNQILDTPTPNDDMKALIGNTVSQYIQAAYPYHVIAAIKAGQYSKRREYIFDSQVAEARVILTVLGNYFQSHNFKKWEFLFHTQESFIQYYFKVANRYLLRNAARDFKAHRSHLSDQLEGGTWLPWSDEFTRPRRLFCSFFGRINRKMKEQPSARIILNPTKVTKTWQQLLQDESEAAERYQT